MSKKWMKKIGLAACTSILIQMSVWAAETDLVENETIVQKEDTGEPIEILNDVEMLDYPARKEGNVVEELLEGDEVTLLETQQDIWAKVAFEDAGSGEVTGYIPISCLKLDQNANPASGDKGTIHQGSGDGIFTEAIDGVTQVNEGEIEGITVAKGEVINVSEDASLKALGTFRITHYCACSICCGPYVNGLTATGTTCTSNRTIAVNPTQIPYGSRVVINGQIYVAEDCGGAIKDNCIDIYMPTHEEALQAGTFYTDVYLLIE